MTVFHFFFYRYTCLIFIWKLKIIILIIKDWTLIMNRLERINEA